MSEDEKNSDIPGLIVLEEASQGPDQALSSDPLFGDNPLAMATAKAVALESMIRLLVQEIKFTDFCRELLLIFMKSIRCEAASILEVDHTSNTLFFRAAAGQSSDSISQFRVPVGQGIAGHVAESLQPLIVANLAENRLHLAAIAKAVGFEARNLVALPILVRGKVYGVLELLNRQVDPEFSPQDVEFLSYLCDVAGKAIEARMMIAWANEQAERKSA